MIEQIRARCVGVKNGEWTSTNRMNTDIAFLLAKVDKLLDAGDKAFTLLLLFLINPIDKKCVVCHRPPENHKKTCIYGQIVKQWNDERSPQ